MTLKGRIVTLVVTDFGTGAASQGVAKRAGISEEMMEQGDLDIVRLEETRKAHVPVTPGTTDMPAFQQEYDVERAAAELAGTRARIDDLVRAIRGKVGIRHLKHIVRDTTRRATFRVAPGRHVLMVLLLVAGSVLITARVASGLASRQHAAG